MYRDVKMLIAMIRIISEKQLVFYVTHKSTTESVIIIYFIILCDSIITNKSEWNFKITVSATFKYICFNL